MCERATNTMDKFTINMKNTAHILDTQYVDDFLMLGKEGRGMTPRSLLRGVPTFRKNVLCPL
jgi:hypothetical protein